ncbi:MAG: PTS sugar transporter subunit IIA [Terrisporobacter othiniensis]|uniref:BglG family transcription antiterminator n=1 Tax=Terrisporobacter petrolearius TaxID=1460447 RepID=UPI0022E7F4EC|nr:PTS sugar transporter subunit IIA [Terrisporobacter petrolearius]MDU4862361.1 PTS sugar transporter subunit IIA [Terrisporobacter othiniensis]MDU6996186.1 PTS sugar transporter subunit IIA [Terrisporobacter othiniensis]
MIVLNKRQINIIDFLQNSSEWTTIENIAKVFDVSVRTIRNDLDCIKTLLKDCDAKLERKPKVGVKLIIKKGESIDHILKGYKNKLYSPEERALMIALILMIKGNATIEELSEDIEVSKNTLVNDLKLAEAKLKEFDISISKKSYHGTFIEENNDEKLGDAFLKLYSRLSEGQDKEIYKWLYKYSNINEEYIKTIIEAVEEEKSIQYTEESLEELEIILLFTLSRVLNNQEIKLDTNDDYENSEFKTFKNIIEKVIDKKIHNDKIEYLLKIFKGAKIAKDFNLNKEEKINKITSEVLSELYTMLNIEVDSDAEFIRQMQLHLEIAIYRVENNLVINNPLLEEIKYKMSFIYGITEEILSKKKDIIGVEFPEAEIAYMAMYFGTIFEKYAKGNFSANVLVVCNGGLATSSLLKSRMNLMIPEIKIQSICRLKDVDDYLNKEIDFIVSTVPLQIEDYKVIQVNPLLESGDSQKIKSEIYTIWYEKNCKYLADKVKNENESDLTKIILEKYAQFEQSIEDWREAIEIAAKPLIKDKKIEKAYVNDSIRVIETLGNYMMFIPEIAFVHATPENVIENAVSILNLKNPIDFGSKNKSTVKTIVVLANKEENKNLINLTNILIKDDNIKKFKNAKSYEDLKSII